MLPGFALWAYSGPPLLQSASPLYSPWLPSDPSAAWRLRISQFVLWWAVAGGTSTVTVEGSFDGANLDADLAYSVGTSPATLSLISPYFRAKVAQTTADATKTKLVVIGKT